MAVFQDCQDFHNEGKELITLIPAIISQGSHFEIFKAES